MLDSVTEPLRGKPGTWNRRRRLVDPSVDPDSHVAAIDDRRAVRGTRLLKVWLSRRSLA
jgi:hypothetical protein